MPFKTLQLLITNNVINKRLKKRNLFDIAAIILLNFIKYRYKLGIRRKTLFYNHTR